MIKLGNKVRDKVTGFEGIATGRVEYLTGCTQIGITPPAKDGEVKATQYFDAERLEFIDTGIAPAEVTGANAGGPNRDVPR